MCLILDTSFFSDVEFGVFKVKKNVFQQWVMIAEANLTLSDVYLIAIIRAGIIFQSTFTFLYKKNRVEMKY